MNDKDKKPIETTETTALHRLRELARGNPTPHELEEACAAVAADEAALREELLAQRQLREREQKHYLQEAREGVARLNALGDRVSEALDGLKRYGDTLDHLITVRVVDETSLSVLPGAKPLSCASASLILREVLLALQAAEELGGPELPDYLALMQRVAEEALGRARSARDAAA